MISVSNVTMRYGAKLLFEDVSVTFTSDRRYGLTGPNGAGKSTFMKVLTGELDAQKGTVVRPKKIGVLKQNQYEFDAYRVDRYRHHGQQGPCGPRSKSARSSTTSRR